jgi:hypothetical protein
VFGVALLKALAEQDRDVRQQVAVRARPGLFEDGVEIGQLPPAG